MKKIEGIVFICFCLCTYSDGLWASVNEYRLNSALTAKFSDHWTASLSYQSRWNNDLGHVRKHSDIGIIYTGRITWLDVGLNFRKISRRLGERKEWLDENRYYLSFTTRHRIFNVGVAHRVRMEYNNFEDEFRKFGTARYRFSINPPFELGHTRERRIVKDYKYRPYSQLELSYNSLDSSITSHSILVGMSFKLSQYFITNVFYQYEKKQSQIEHIESNVIGVDIKLLF